MGPARVRALVSSLHVASRADLARALAAGRVGELRGFGPVLRAKLERELAVKPDDTPHRLPLSVAAEYAEPLRRYLAAVGGVERVEIAGSYRRGRDTVGDLDVLLSAPPGTEPIAALEQYPDVREVTASGATKAAGILRNGLGLDVRVVPPESFGAALQYFTGSKQHGIHVRRRAQERGLKLNEYGL
ncbi:family X DNA polymerase IV, partial [mine drainage metagenome]